MLKHLTHDKIILHYLSHFSPFKKRTSFVTSGECFLKMHFLRKKHKLPCVFMFTHLHLISCFVEISRDDFLEWMSEWKCSGEIWTGNKISVASVVALLAFSSKYFWREEGCDLTLMIIIMQLECLMKRPTRNVILFCCDIFWNNERWW